MKHQPIIPSSKSIPEAILKRDIDACSRTKDNICQFSDSLGLNDKSVLAFNFISLASAQAAGDVAFYHYWIIIS